MKRGPKPTGAVEARARAMERKLAGQRTALKVRNAEIRRRVATGETLIAIANDYRLTVGRIRQIDHRWQSRRADR